jgi:hypothetical protein
MPFENTIVIGERVGNSRCRSCEVLPFKTKTTDDESYVPLDQCEDLHDARAMHLKAS